MLLREVSIDDADAIAAVYAPYVRDTIISFETNPPNGEEMRARIEMSRRTYPWLVAEEHGQAIGYAYASAHSSRAAYAWSADVAIYIGAAHQRRGLGRRLYGALFAILERQGFRGLYAGITLPNPASVGLHRAMGMQDIGVYRKVGFKLGGWQDVLWMGLVLGDESSPAHHPVLFERLVRPLPDLSGTG